MKYTITNYTINTFYDLHSRDQISIDADFQRGQVWNVPRKKKFIDTILRKWPFPPIQILEYDNGDRFVLDGVQRASTIIDFLDNKFTVDSRIKPIDEELSVLHGMTFSQIESKAKSDSFFRNILDNILNSQVTVFLIYDAQPEEIAELFYRFNSPMLLSITEKRNAFIGPVKNQIQDLIYFFEELGASQGTIGFSNRRNLYEDPILKLCYTVENEIYDKKIHSEELMDVYRNNKVFSEETIRKVKESMASFMKIVNLGFDYKFSSSSLFSILLFLVINDLNDEETQIILKFTNQHLENKTLNNRFIKEFFQKYSIYASTDIKSIQARQYSLYFLLKYYNYRENDKIEIFNKEINRLNNEDFNFFTNEFQR